MGVGAVSRAMARLKVGDMIGLRGPFGSTWPLDVCSGKDVMVIAGGLGLAPLRPTIYSVMENRDCYNRAMLLYGSRSPDMLLFPDQLKEWEQSGKMEVSVTVDSADKNWKGNVGVVTELINKAEFSPDNMLAMLCGPEVMMRFCAYALLDRGMKPEDIYVSMERNMKCGVGQCGRCQYGPYFVCKDGPVFSFDQVEQLFKVREV
jgi:NAD(P)H-flavin reductase